MTSNVVAYARSASTLIDCLSIVYECCRFHRGTGQVHVLSWSHNLVDISSLSETAFTCVPSFGTTVNTLVILSSDMLKKLYEAFGEPEPPSSNRWRPSSDLCFTSGRGR